MESMGMTPRDSAAWFLLLRQRQRRHGRQRPVFVVPAEDAVSDLDAAEQVSSHVKRTLSLQGPASRCQALEEAFSSQGHLGVMYSAFERCLDEFNKCKDEYLLLALNALTRSQRESCTPLLSGPVCCLFSLCRTDMTSMACCCSAARCTFRGR